MRLVDFQHIQNGVRKLAAVKETLEHIQDSLKETVAALTDGIIAQGSGVTVLFGCVNSEADPDYTISAGWVYYDGEIYEVPTFSGTATGGEVPVLSLNTTYLATDPARYKKADGTFETINTHSIRKMLWSFAASGSGIADFADVVTLKSRISSLLSGEFQPVGSYAPINSPTFTGVPAAPTPATSDDSTKIATTAFVKAVVTALVGGAPTTLDALNELAAALGNDANFSTTILTALSTKADISDIEDFATGGIMDPLSGPNTFSGTEYSIDTSSSVINSPVTSETFQYVTTGSRQVAIQLTGAAQGSVYLRTYSGSWGAWAKILGGLQVKIVDIGDWNMDADDDVAVAHGLTADKIAFVMAKIRADDGGSYSPFGNNLFNPVNPPGANEWETWFPTTYISWNSSNIVLARMDGSSYDSTSYNATGYNRGKVYIWYEP